MVMEVDSRPPLCEGACLRPVHDPALQTERSEAHRTMQVPFLLNTGPEAQGPTPQCSHPVSVLAILCPGPCKGLQGEGASISGDAQDKGGRGTAGPRDQAPCPGASQVVLSSSFSTRPEEDPSHCHLVHHQEWFWMEDCCDFAETLSGNQWLGSLCEKGFPCLHLGRQNREQKYTGPSFTTARSCSYSWKHFLKELYCEVVKVYFLCLKLLIKICSISVKHLEPHGHRMSYFNSYTFL